ncbi:hypothetical protein BH20CHL6_BH20CHL6_15380 [soil metagenome]
MIRRAVQAFRVLLAVALVAVAMPGLAHAATEIPRLDIRPMGVDGPYFELTLRPGESRTLGVELANHGTQPVRARTYAADVYTLVNGGFGARLAGEASGEVTAWLDYEARTLDLDRGRGRGADVPGRRARVGDAGRLHHESRHRER